ncbi:hypothetical protein BX266_5508 [Streptomyces sp. TLI_171]|nr:hypothetical protein BX266_5508 [Streptomyces sp. TLI_171]
MATTSHDTVVTRWAMDRRLHDLTAGLHRQKWKRGSCGEGAQGLRIYDRARVEVRPWHRPDRRHWLLARRSITDPAKIAYYIAYAPADATLNELIAVAGARWTIEECFQTAKGQCGLDDHQVRRYPGRHQAHHSDHSRPCLPRRGAGATARKWAGPARMPDLFPLTVPEIRRLITGLPRPVHRSTAHVLHRSRRRRRRQHQARTSHYMRRGHSPRAEASSR